MPADRPTAPRLVKARPEVRNKALAPAPAVPTNKVVLVSIVDPEDVADADSADRVDAAGKVVLPDLIRASVPVPAGKVVPAAPDSTVDAVGVVSGGLAKVLAPGLEDRAAKADPNSIVVPVDAADGDLAGPVDVAGKAALPALTKALAPAPGGREAGVVLVSMVDRVDAVGVGSADRGKALVPVPVNLVAKVVPASIVDPVDVVDVVDVVVKVVSVGPAKDLAPALADPVALAAPVSIVAPVGEADEASAGHNKAPAPADADLASGLRPVVTAGSLHRSNKKQVCERANLEGQ